MSETPPVSTSPDGNPAERSRVLVYVLGGLVLVSAVVAAVVIVSSGGATSVPAKDPVAQVRAGEWSLTVGSASARPRVVVDEDFGSAESRAFEISSRDFLRDVAARGDVVVEYHAFALTGSAYSSRALAAWGVVLEKGTTRQALALKDLLFDQPVGTDLAAEELAGLARKAGIKDAAVLDAVRAADPASATSATPAATAAGVRTTPSVELDGKPVTASSPVALADELQRRILGARR